MQGFNFPLGIDPFTATMTKVVSAWKHDVGLKITTDLKVKEILGPNIVNNLDSNIVVNETQNILELCNKNYTFTEEGEAYIIYSLSKEGLTLTITIPVNWVEGVVLILPSNLGV